MACWPSMRSMQRGPAPLLLLRRAERSLQLCYRTRHACTAASANVHRPLKANIQWHADDPAISYARLPQPWATGDESALLLRAQSLVPSPVLEAIRKLVPQLDFDRSQDSVDTMPMFQVQFVSEGRFVHDQLAAVLEEPLLDRVVPLLRRSRLRSDQAGGLVLCEALPRVNTMRTTAASTQQL